MRILVITNLYPPQDLGGYGRCISDFVWGLINRGHFVQVLSSDAPYLLSNNSIDDNFGPNDEPVCRELHLKGSYDGGVTMITDNSRCSYLDLLNRDILNRWLSFEWDGVLLGNIDLLGPEILPVLIKSKLLCIHHIGFVYPPYDFRYYPLDSNYLMVPASRCVRQSLVSASFPISDSPVIYPGVRNEIFDPINHLNPSSLKLSLSLVDSGIPLGSIGNPLKIGFAGLLMGSKGLHTVVQALIMLHHNGVYLQAMFAGADFQNGYRERLESMLNDAGLSGSCRFVGQLGRPQLSRFWSLQHIGIFPSIHPEAFGIVSAEIMASRIVLLTTAVGGSAELVDHNFTGICFEPDQPQSLFNSLNSLVSRPELMDTLSSNGYHSVKSSFSVIQSVSKLEQLFSSFSVLA